MLIFIIAVELVKDIASRLDVFFDISKTLRDVKRAYTPREWTSFLTDLHFNVSCEVTEVSDNQRQSTMVWKGLEALFPHIKSIWHRRYAT